MSAAAQSAITCESSDIAAAFTQAMTSLDILASYCRAHGIDPMKTLVTMMLGDELTGQPAGTREAIATSLAIPSVDPTDPELIAHSHGFVDALGRNDVDSVAAALAPSFIHFAGGPTLDREAMLATLAQRAPEGPRFAARTWDEERVVRKHGVLVFMGKAHEEQSGNDTHGGYLYDGWYLLQWVLVDGAWRVQLFTWQTESTEREWWNETFKKGRGFSHEPNRLLVEAVSREQPGTALDVAMGQGRNAFYLASQGWKVTGVDGSIEGLRIAREQAAASGLAIDTVNADIDEWDFGSERFDLVTLMYAGDHAKWIQKIKTSLRSGGLFVLEGWAKVSPDSDGFGERQLARLFEDYEILRDETREGVPDWACDKGKLVRFIARKP